MANVGILILIHPKKVRKEPRYVCSHQSKCEEARLSQLHDHIRQSLIKSWVNKIMAKGAVFVCLKYLIVVSLIHGYH